VRSSNTDTDMGDQVNRLTFVHAVRVVAGVVATACALLPGIARATTPGHWDPITAPNGQNIDQVATARTPDGRLHVIWHHETSPSMSSLVQTVLNPDGSVGGSQEIASGWAGVGDAVILRTSGGNLLVFSGATRGLSATDPLDSLEQWTSSDGGATWALTPVPIANGTGFSDPLGGALAGDGATPFVAWTTTDGVFVHRGADPPDTNLNLQQAAGFGCCGYDPGVTLDNSTGAIVVAWYAIINQGDAVYVRTIDPATGAPTGTTLRMPGTLNSVSPDQRVGVTSRPGRPGVYAAYNGGGPSQSIVLVWRVGAPRATTLATNHSTELRDPAIAATPDGRLWVAWSASGRIWARRSNRAATKWGAVTSIRVRHGTGTVYKVALDATTGLVDVFGAFAPQSGSGVQTWHSQMLPGLTLSISPAQLELHAGKAGSVKATVTDAGAPVKGASVALAGHTAKTNANGVAKLKVGPSTHALTLTAGASKAGYVGASVRVRVRLK
jgi:hypothetical protein